MSHHDRCLPKFPDSFRPGDRVPIAFVGEAPSDEELGHQPLPEPLVGPSGREFNRILRTAQVDRGDCLVTNVFDFQLPDNELKNITGGKAEWDEWRKDGYNLPSIRFGQSIRWLRPEYEVQLERLRQELLEANPRVIVPLGGTALWAFTGYNNISAHRGVVHEASMVVPGAKLLPTFHPAYVSRQHKMYIIVAQDIVKAKRESKREGFHFPDREIWIEPTLEDLGVFKRRYLDDAPYISVDIETGLGQIDCIGFSDGPSHALVVPFLDLEKPSRSYWPTLEAELQALDFVEEVLTCSIPKLLQNGPYDVYWIHRKWNIQVANYCEDTRLLHHAMFPELPKDLQFMGSVYAEQHAWKQMRKGSLTTKRDE